MLYDGYATALESPVIWCLRDADDVADWRETRKEVVCRASLLHTFDKAAAHDGKETMKEKRAWKESFTALLVSDDDGGAGGEKTGNVLVGLGRGRRRRRGRGHGCGRRSSFD